MKKKKMILIIFFIVVLFVSGRIIYHNLTFQYRFIPEKKNACAIYYLLNLDGMKGLGHVAFLVVDEKGTGYLYSYNGMQYNLLQCLLGKEGIGKMKQFTLQAEAVTDFLETGDLTVSDVSECDNFDRTVYRYITREDFETIVQGAQTYVEVGDKYETLYAKVLDASGEEQTVARQEMVSFTSQKGQLKYQIYMHNCDTVARELIALIDVGMKEFNTEKAHLTPSGNFEQMSGFLGEEWGCIPLGTDTLIEKILWNF